MHFSVDRSAFLLNLVDFFEKDIGLSRLQIDGDQDLGQLWKPFMYRRSKRGPKPEPWGTPQEILSEATLPVDTYCTLLEDLNHSTAIPLTPKLFSFSNRMG